MLHIPIINFNLQIASFLIGIVIGLLLAWALSLTRPLIQQAIESQREKARQRALEGSSSLEIAYRKIIFRQTQGMHLTASLFALDEIALEPQLLAPPAYVDPNTPHPIVDIVGQAIPYMPAYPEVATAYRGATLTIPEALSGGVNLIINGQAGSGKTTALAYLASQIVNRKPSVAALHDSIPFFIHVADLGLPLDNPKKPTDYLAPIASKMASMAGILEARRIPGFVEYAFTNGRALLLLDGVDELSQSALQEVTAYLRVLQRQFPEVRMITTGNFDFVDGLLSLGFVPLAIMPWTPEKQKEFLIHWGELWQKYVARESWMQGAASALDPLLLNRWLSEGNLGLTPLEYTLKVWAAYAGDARGAQPADAIEAHLRRLLPSTLPMEAIFTLGTQASLAGEAIFDSQHAREWIKAFEPVELSAQQANPQNPSAAHGNNPSNEATFGPKEGEQKTSHKKGAQGQAGRPVSLISQLAMAGILAAHGGSRVRFAHPLYLGFLAGKGLDENIAEVVAEQPAWIGQTVALRYFASQNDATSIVDRLLTLEDNLLLRPRLEAARMLREAPKNSPWRGKVMGSLIKILQDEDTPIALRGQAMAALVLSNDTGTAALFRQLLVSPSNEVRRMAALGAGMLGDAKAVPALIDVLTSATGAARQAACLALVKINLHEALVAIGNVLVSGDEQLRIAAAEALANNTEAGYETLRDGVTNEDILVRRAIVYGLARVKEPWAQELLARIPTQDDQWVVRNVAVEILEARQRPNPHIPQRLVQPSDTPWMVELAGKYGMGIIPGQPAIDLMLLALKDDNHEYRLAALRHLRNHPTEGVLAALYPQLYGDDREMKESTYQILAEMALGGIKLPHPMQFGLG